MCHCKISRGEREEKGRREDEMGSVAMFLRLYCAIYEIYSLYINRPRLIKFKKGN